MKRVFLANNLSRKRFMLRTRPALVGKRVALLFVMRLRQIGFLPRK